MTDLALADWRQADAAPLAERAIRPAVLIRKNSYANQSDQGAVTQAVLMSIYRTLRQRGHDPLETVLTALRQLASTGELPLCPLETLHNAEGLQPC